MEREQTTVRLTIRATQELDNLIRQEAARRGTNVNQVMLYILNRYFLNSDKSISPLEDS